MGPKRREERRSGGVDDHYARIILEDDVVSRLEQILLYEDSKNGRWAIGA
jgi:hypothetical protein